MKDLVNVTASDFDPDRYQNQYREVSRKSSKPTRGDGTGEPRDSRGWTLPLRRRRCFGSATCPLRLAGRNDARSPSPTPPRAGRVCYGLACRIRLLAWSPYTAACA